MPIPTSNLGVQKQDSLDLLHPSFRPIAVKWLEEVLSAGLRVKVLETLRTEARQQALQAQGASQVKVGWHQVGLALDFACFDHEGKYLTNDLSGDYRRAGEIAESLGCVWGGRWKHLVDSSHLEYHPGFTLQMFLNGKKGGLVA